ncbi:iron reductase [Phaeobacter gallaeciensis]|uniref:Iron reductase n=2 Tax=Roseobacteraceae TaxID=2854170 RepID=A0A366WTM5_9RHOB|nr:MULTISPECIES: ferric reductase-like transmembrane domain-containing protein [Roseobacteraceae]MBT3140922.1 ferric reductase-like transmembrane domain-containing protein [Falsiruegeria litorea]RBW52866.1 iron reductase [Phaeobacter gallaeciensis]
MFSRISPYWLWVLLALPAFTFISDAFTSTDPKVFRHLLHPTGEFGARLLIITMLASPLALVFRGWRGPRWLKKNRRYFGVAAFGYAVLHLVFYFIDRATLTKVFGEVTQLDIWTGWLAFAIYLPLVATSFDAALKALGPRWKSLQRWVYAAAVLTLLHWAAHDEFKGLAPALIHFGPLILLESYRIWYWYLRPRPAHA